MALGQQKSPTQTLVTFAYWLKRNGFRVGEMHGFSTVHRVHTGGSWHYDKAGIWGKALDANHPAGGNYERAKLAVAASKAQELGLAVIFGQYGSNGPTATHQHHLHVDVGPYSNLGRGSFYPKGGGDILTRALCRAANMGASEIWGSSLEKRLQAIRAASKGKFPYGVRYVQRVIGVSDDNVWGPISRRANLACVEDIQVALKKYGRYRGAIDKKWGRGTDSAWLSARSLRWRR